MKATMASIAAICLVVNTFGQVVQVAPKSNWNDTSIAINAYDARYNEVWGIVQNGVEYAVIGSTKGTHILDVSNPKYIYEVVFIPGRAQGKAIIHRDYHDYKGYLYMVCDEGNSSLQIADLSYLPDSAPLVYDSDLLISRAHNIFIDTARARLYAMSVVRAAAPVNIKANILCADLTVPTAPKFISQFGEFGYHDAFVRNDTAYVNYGRDGLWVYDMSDPSTLNVIGELTTYPDQGYNHAGWLNEKGNIYAMTDETHGMRIKVCDVSDLNDIDVISLIGSGVDSNSVPHNVMIKNDILYISYYHDGLYLFDISDPYHPYILGYYDTYGAMDHDSYKGAWGVFCFLPSGNILVSDMQSGLFVFDAGEFTGINSASTKAATLNIIPNPVRDQATMSFEGIAGESYQLDLFNTAGQKVRSTANIRNHNFTFDRNDLRRGNYIYRLWGNKGSVFSGVMVLD